MTTSTDFLPAAVRWKPTWAFVLAWIFLVLSGVAVLFGTFATISGVIGLSQGQGFSEIGVAFGVPPLVVGLLVGIPLLVFIIRGGKVALSIAACALVVSVGLLTAAVVVLAGIVQTYGG